MNPEKQNGQNRRGFIKTTGQAAAVSALAGASIPHVHAQSSDTIQIALVGCGGRGTGAAGDALNVPNGNTKLVAMADVFPNKLENSYRSLKNRFKGKVDVPAERQFIGFDGYKKAIDSLKPGDVAIFTSPCAFRWVHYSYAIEKGVNVFMEKPVTPDGPTSRKMLELNKKAKQKNLKVGVGLMVRHCRSRQALHKRIMDGEIGDVQVLRAYRMFGPHVGFDTKNETNLSDLMFQIREFHGFIWLSGGIFSDFNIHQIDECSWMKNAWPIKAQATGGRHYRLDNIDQNFDSYSVEYTYADGSKFFFYGRNMVGSHNEFASYVHGTKGCGIISTSGHAPGKCRTFSGQNFTRRNMLWEFPQPEQNPYQLEWNDLIEAIRKDQPYNEVDRGVYASVATSMGRMAAHTGQVITFDQMLNHEHEMSPGTDKLTMDSESPLPVDPEGKYPVPMPGIVKDREYRYFG